MILWIGVALTTFILGFVVAAAFALGHEADVETLTQLRDEQTRAAAAKWYELDAGLRGRGWVNVTPALIISQTPRFDANLNFIHSPGYPQEDD